jgi:hypothetical protein
VTLYWKVFSESFVFPKRVEEVHEKKRSQINLFFFVAKIILYCIFIAVSRQG